jgi:hypothetical protein
MPWLIRVSFVFLLAFFRLSLLPVYGDDPKFRLHELSVWVVDATQEQANQQPFCPSAMPPVVSSDRGRSKDASGIAPFSLLTFHGEPVTDLEVDLRVQSGRFLSHWPKSDAKGSRLRWIELGLTPQLDDPTRLATVDAGHWFQQARNFDSLFVTSGARAERFMVYDCEFKLAPPIKLAGGPDRYEVTNLGTSPLVDLVISVPTANGRRIGRLDALAAKPKETKEEKDAKPAAAAELMMSPPVAEGSAELAKEKAAFGESLRRTGLTDKEIELLVSAASPTLFESKEMAVVFRLPPDAIEERLPLVTYPAPIKTVRVALVFVKNIDPNIEKEVQTLVAQLGAAKYAEREAAEKRLAELRRLAIPALRTALKSKDLEVVFRAERILMAQDEKID